MRDEFHPEISVEKMAAWIDGNLLAEEMTRMAEQINADPMLEEMVSMGDEIDCDIEAFEASSEPLPEELQDDDFDIPRTTRWSDRQVGSMFGEVCCAMPARYEEYDCCDEATPIAASVSVDLTDSDEEKSLIVKLKELLSEKEEE